MPPTQEFANNRSAARQLVPALWLVSLHVAVISAGFFAPFDYTEQDRTALLQPPTRMHFVDPQGRFHLQPFVCLPAVQRADGGNREDCSRRFPVRLFVIGAPYRYLGVFESRRHLFGAAPPGKIHLLGTDDLGRDQFTRFLYGGQVSLLTGLLAAGIAITLGLLLGIAAGYYRGWTDNLIMGTTELSLALPWLYLLFAVRAWLPLNAPPSTAVLMVVSILGMLGWPRPARLIRGAVLTATEREYVLVSRSFGGSELHLFRTHLIPQIAPLVMTETLVLIPRFILAEVGLSFLGLGVNEPAASWGNMLAELQHYSALTSHWWMLVPGALLVLTLLSYFLISSASHWLSPSTLRPHALWNADTLFLQTGGKR